MCAKIQWYGIEANKKCGWTANTNASPSGKGECTKSLSGAST